jgi:hypothetical protein
MDERTVDKLDVPVAPVSIGSIKTDVNTIRKASETAAILDQYQYQMCKICKGLGKQDEEWRKYNKLRVADHTSNYDISSRTGIIQRRP